MQIADSSLRGAASRANTPMNGNDGEGEGGGDLIATQMRFSVVFAANKMAVHENK